MVSEFLYLTADRVGEQTGGGKVTYHESEALKGLGTPADCEVIGRDELEAAAVRAPRTPDYFEEPWKWDFLAQELINWGSPPKLCHIYSGTFTRTVKRLQRTNCRVTYTVAAHSVETSRKEHELLGCDYAKLYPHLCEPGLWALYSGGYRAADVLIAPSTHSGGVLRSQGMTRRVEIIPHGCDYPKEVRPPPGDFRVGYLGAVGPDKGLVYLLRAWKELNYLDSILVLGGKESTSPFVTYLINTQGGGNIIRRGWVDDLADFYGGISLYVQPSVSEGFGCEVLEAMAHSRPVVCSDGAGAKDLLGKNDVFRARDPGHLARVIERARSLGSKKLAEWGLINRAVAPEFTWEKIRARYQTLWDEVLRS